MPRPLLFPLNRLSAVDVAALQAALRPAKLLQPMFMRQRIRGFQLRLAPDLPVNRPWNAASSRFGITDVATEARTTTPSVVHQLLPLPTVTRTITGVSRDSTGAALAGCTCTLFRVQTSGSQPVFTQLQTVVSDGSGNYSFNVGVDGPYRVTWDLDGAPIRAGISLKTLAGV